jgi:hypothetical protein
VARHSCPCAVNNLAPCHADLWGIAGIAPPFLTSAIHRGSDQAQSHFTADSQSVCFGVFQKKTTTSTEFFVYILTTAHVFHHRLLKKCKGSVPGAQKGFRAPL